MNLIVTSTANVIVVIQTGGFPFGAWRKDKITSMLWMGNYVLINTEDASFQISNVPIDGCFVIDTINGSAPSSLSDLFDKLVALIA